MLCRVLHILCTEQRSKSYVHCMEIRDRSGHYAAWRQAGRDEGCANQVRSKGVAIGVGQQQIIFCQMLRCHTWRRIIWCCNSCTQSLATVTQEDIQYMSRIRTSSNWLKWMINICWSLMECRRNNYLVHRHMALNSLLLMCFCWMIQLMSTSWGE